MNMQRHDRFLYIVMLYYIWKYLYMEHCNNRARLEPRSNMQASGEDSYNGSCEHFKNQ